MSDPGDLVGLTPGQRAAALRQDIEPRPLFPEMHTATDVQVTYVAEPGGPPDPRVTADVRRVLESMNEPVLHITFVARGQRRTTLVGLGALERRGLPTDYGTLSQMFPALRWSAR